MSIRMTDAEYQKMLDDDAELEALVEQKEWLIENEVFDALYNGLSKVFPDVPHGLVSALTWRVRESEPDMIKDSALARVRFELAERAIKDQD